jgi:ketopantoate reductase
VHLSIVGAGALGLAYGVWGAAGAEVSFVVRRDVGARGGARVERVGRTAAEAREVREIAALRASTTVAPEADVIVVTVRADQLEAALATVAATESEAPVVILTPMMPAAYAQARRVLGARVRAAMPAVIAYVVDADAAAPTGASSSTVRVRAWLPAAPTLIDEQRGTADAQTALAALAETWTAAGLSTRFAMGVHESNPATTAAFIPLTMAIDAAGSLDALLADTELLALAVRAADEGAALGARLGQIAPWATLLGWLARPWVIELGGKLAKSRAPEAFAYVDQHFGRKIHAQNVAMAGDLVALAKERGEAHAALEELSVRLGSR